ncbi:calponin homology domain-containing protein DDB_G0272472-like [Heliangelus exortis]|uniref:calponin homology domain-containing protein DDB_G0272472-like n=1 Tax=Heliangelus exortis TaxID=472823 RepID=UPI003A94D218
MAEPQSGVRHEGEAARVESWRPGPHSPAAQPTPDPHGCGGTGAAGRAPAPASLGPGNQEVAAEQHQLRPAVRVDGCIDLRSLWVQHKAGANDDLEILKLKMELLESQERIHTAQRSKATQQQQKRDLQKRRLLWQKQDLEKRRLQWKKGLEKRQLQEKKGQEQRFSQKCSSQAPERPRRVCYEKLYGYVTEVVHIEYMKDVRERLEARAPSQQQVVSSASIWLMDAEPAASAPSEEEEHHALLGPVEQEEAKAPASDLAEPDKAGETESKPPTPHSPPDDDPALLDAAEVLVRKVLCRVTVALPCRARQQPQEPEQDLVQVRDETAAASPPAASQKTESALPAEPQEEASTAPLFPAAAQEDRPSMATPVAADHQAQASTDNVTLAVHEDQVASPFPQSPLSHTSTPHLDPDDEGDAGDPSGCPGNPGHEVNYETRGDSQPSQGPRDMSEDDPGITLLLCSPARQRQPSRFRRELRALRRAFRRCSCMAGEQEEPSSPASTRKVPRDVHRP